MHTFTQELLNPLTAFTTNVAYFGALIFLSFIVNLYMSRQLTYFQAMR